MYFFNRFQSLKRSLNVPNSFLGFLAYFVSHERFAEICCRTLEIFRSAAKNLAILSAQKKKKIIRWKR